MHLAGITEIIKEQAFNASQPVKRETVLRIFFESIL